MRLFGLMCGLGLAVVACAGPSGEGGGPRTGSGLPAGPSDTSGANTAEQMEEVQKTVRNGQSAIINCYTEEMERQKDKKLAGNVMVKMLIGTRERAEQVEIGERTLNAPTLHACIIQTVKSWEFPRLNAPSWFTYPFEFSPAY